MKTFLIGIALTVLLVFTVSCGSSKVGSDSQMDNNTAAKGDSMENITYMNISPQDAKKRLDSEKNIVLLDVRTKEEYEEKHIPGSFLIPVDVIEKDAGSKLTDKNADIFVYCRSGRRSVTASEALVKMGYRNVYNLGGIIDWPYETVKGR
ncbi:rhodanese-like domain-containing protein [Pseudobacteroides cellulosolvens]|uniref:Rhodanese-like protein n=1 Tax=Pseudobacteroides cellulosolvens ATCC 35603 = DSM 2933 TaxID=398512 RepID=A0A0L6JM12_9FIRM|nr:rhodanese-like domain-containing protein [Pseudobacteroides cellulosolvens]KNY26841.1 Rhodanese-like protein [Pseudobacteroides cellulosolvens ATCC 35603 = DSM 2933]